MRYNVIMPLKQIDYSKIIMYRIYSESCDFIYVGHTNNTTKRKSSHKHDCTHETSPRYNFPIYKQIREKGGWSNFIFAEIEEFPCENAVQARIREQYWIEHYKANLNSIKAYQSPEESKEHIKEQKKQYQETHKEHIKERKKQWYEANKEHCKEQKKQYRETHKERINQKMTCECGSEICVNAKARHYKTMKHIQYLESL